MKEYTFTKRELLDINGAVNSLSLLKYPDAELEFIMNLAENKSILNSLSEPILQARDTILRSYAEKKGDHYIQSKGEYVIPDEKAVTCGDKVVKLLDEKLKNKVRLHQFDKSNFEKVEGILPAFITSIMPLFKE